MLGELRLSLSFKFQPSTDVPFSENLLIIIQSTTLVKCRSHKAQDHKTHTRPRSLGLSVAKLQYQSCATNSCTLWKSTHPSDQSDEVGLLRSSHFECSILVSSSIPSWQKVQSFSSPGHPWFYRILHVYLWVLGRTLSYMMCSSTQTTKKPNTLYMLSTSLFFCYLRWFEHNNGRFQAPSGSTIAGK